jgi:uncharacterized integral membrane protein
VSYQPKSSGKPASEKKGAARAGAQRRLNARLAAVAVLAAILIVFVVQNAQRVQVDFVILHGRTPLWVALVITAVIGGIIGQVLEYSWRRRRPD